MKKLIVFVTLAFIGLSSAPALAENPAPTPETCLDSAVTFDGKTELCESVLPPVYPVVLPAQALPPTVTPAVVPPAAPAVVPPAVPAVVPPAVPAAVTPAVPAAVTPAAPTVTTTIVTAVDPGSAELPRTGSAGVSTTLGIAALLILGGGIVAVATRRRATTSSTT